MLRRSVPLLIVASAAMAEDTSPPQPPVAPPEAVEVPGVQTPGPAVPQETPPNWTITGRLGAFLSNVSTNNAETSHDPTINGTKSSTSYLGTYDGQFNWKSGSDSVDNLFKGRYGRIRTDGGEWVENNDEFRYDGVYRREIYEPHFIYLGWGGETVFTGPEPEEDPFDPTTARASGGYGQRYEDFLPDKNHLEFRVGARAQKQWGRSVAPEDDRLETGIEAFIRYEHLVKRGDGDYDVRFFAQYEGFSEFNDLEHITNLITAGLTVQLTRYLAVELGLRAYYETRTKEDNGTRTGYNQWSVRQDSLFGLTVTY